MLKGIRLCAVFNSINLEIHFHNLIPINNFIGFLEVDQTYDLW